MCDTSALVKRNGARLFFTDLSVALRDLPGIVQYQVIQDEIEKFVAKVVLQEGAPIPGVGIRQVMEQHLGYLPESLDIEKVEEIPRGKNGKFYASICNL